jgi:hypothetical protein
MMPCQHSALSMLLPLLVARSGDAAEASLASSSTNCQYSCGDSSACSMKQWMRIRGQPPQRATPAWPLRTACTNTHQELCCLQKVGRALPARAQRDGRASAIR